MHPGRAHARPDGVLSAGRPAGRPADQIFLAVRPIPWPRPKSSGFFRPGWRRVIQQGLAVNRPTEGVCRMLSYFVFAANDAIGRIHRDDRGMTAVESGLLLALVAGVVVTAMLFVFPAIGALFSNSASCAASGTCNGP